jgi:uncharacterized membrane protein YfcA
VLSDQLPVVAAASAAAFGLAVLSAVAGFGGGVLLLPVFTALFGLRVAVPMLTLTQVSSNAFRVWLNRAVVIWRRVDRRPRRPGERSFVAVGAASGLGSSLLGSVGPLTAPFFLAYGLTRAAYIGTEAAGALTMHLSKIAAYGAGDLLTRRVLLYGLALTPATLAGAWTGKKIVGRISDRVMVLLVELGLVAAGVLFIVGA